MNGSNCLTREASKGSPIPSSMRGHREKREGTSYESRGETSLEDDRAGALIWDFSSSRTMRYKLPNLRNVVLVAQTD